VLDGAAAALLTSAEDYGGEIQGGAREVLVSDGVVCVGASGAHASPTGARVDAGAPFARSRAAGGVVLWSSLMGARATRARVIGGAAAEAAFPKIVLGAAVNVAVRLSSVVTAADTPGGERRAVRYRT
jgi:hypothetical protein